MAWSCWGGNSILTDQESLVGQLSGNVTENFSPPASQSQMTTMNVEGEIKKGGGRSNVEVHPLTWSRAGIRRLLRDTNRTSKGFNVALNCDCVYDPLYGVDSRKMLVEVIDELLTVNVDTVVITSVERRRGDGVDEFLRDMTNMRLGGGDGDADTGEENGNEVDVRLAFVAKDEPIEIYITTVKKRTGEAEEELTNKK